MTQLSKNKKLVLSAAYGMRSLGDEAICEAIIGDIFSITQNAYVTVLVLDEDIFFEAHPQWRENKNIRVASMYIGKSFLWRPARLLSFLKAIFTIAHADLFIWGGGGIVRNRAVWLRRYIVPLRIAQFFKKKIIVWSIGVDTISDPEVIRLIDCIRNVAYFSVRDAGSKANFLAASRHFHSEDVRIVRDPVFHLADYDPHRDNEIGPTELPCVGLNLSFWKGDISDTLKVEAFSSSLAVAVNEVYRQRPFSIKYLPTAWGKDDQVFDMFKHHLISSISVTRSRAHTPLAYIESLGEVRAFIGMRLHSLILASNIKRIPLLGVIYDEKVAALKNEKGLENFWSINEITKDPSRLTQGLLACLADPEDHLVDFGDFREDSKEMRNVLATYLRHE